MRLCREGMIGRVSPDGDDWQLAHRIEEPWGDARTVWELQPLTVTRPGTGETTTRFLCATCDEPVDCVVVSADTQSRLARRRGRARVTTVVAVTTGLVLAVSTVGALVGVVVMVRNGAWAVAVAAAAMSGLYGWLAAKSFSYARPWATIPAGDAGVRLASPSRAHELRPPAPRPAIPAPDRPA
ncbi:hypothetical protein BC793_108153 [Actinoplanes xinjiangensis]|uniref:Uncharacterized protein n=1 Tax=Actinoplanes xinjiangensis TaxID=512350 RepID=A0A316FF32_9ACTN|nr:hypothetical protein BC793_108153 [Actinoplanes xinjiangensis]